MAMCCHFLLDKNNTKKVVFVGRRDRLRYYSLMIVFVITAVDLPTFCLLCRTEIDVYKQACLYMPCNISISCI